MDGTLIDSSNGVVEAVNYSLQKMGQPLQRPEAIKSFIGYPLSKMYPHFTEAPLDELYSHFQVKARETIVASTTVLPGVPEMLRTLQEAEFGLAVASTKIRPHITGILEKFGWESVFQAYSGGDEVSNVKPDPEIFRLTLARLGANPEQVVVVGDTVNDILGAKAVPMTVVAVASPYGGEDVVRQSGPDYFLGHVSELPDLLASIWKIPPR